jgi:hypothetical protein
MIPGRQQIMSDYNSPTRNNSLIADGSRALVARALYAAICRAGDRIPPLSSRKIPPKRF